MNAPRSIRVAAIQLCSKPDRDRNLETAQKLMVEAVHSGAELVALPENMSFIGGLGEQVRVAEGLEDGPTVRFLQEFASKHGVAVVGGSIPIKTSDPGRVTNTCLVFDPSGRRVARYDKAHLFDVSLDERHTFEESSVVQAGREPATAQLLGHTLGLSICYDLRFPELYRALVSLGAEILAVPSAFTVPTGKDHWEILLRARAIENQSYVVAPAQFGQHTRERVSYGRTMIVDPWGQVLGSCPDKESVLTCELDFNLLHDVRRRLPALQHARLSPRNAGSFAS